MSTPSLATPAAIRARADLNFCVDRRFERATYPPAVGLRCIERDIRLREYGAGTAPVVGRRSAADAGGEALPMQAPTITSLPSSTTAQ
jgi:hypothetical protein